MENRVLTPEVAAGLVAQGIPPTASEFTAITATAAAILAQGYQQQTEFRDPCGLSDSESKLDLSGLTSLDADSARALARWGGIGRALVMELDLSGLRELDPAVAESLAKWSALEEFEDGLHVLSLDGVERPSAAALEALSRWHTSGCLCLSLSGVQRLDFEQSKALSAWRGGSMHSALRLGGLREVDLKGLEQLVQWSGDLLELGLPQITPDQASVLRRFQGDTLDLAGLMQIDSATAMQLADTNAGAGEEIGNPLPDWNCLVLGPQNRLLQGITPEVADWITDLRIAGIDVQLSSESNRAVKRNCTFMAHGDTPDSKT